MDSLKLFYVVLVAMFLYLTAVQSQMFPLGGGESCSDNTDCAKGCCLMTGRRHRRATGVCQAMRQLGEYCAPGNRLRNYYGSVVYTYSCPCGGGLVCKPKWASQLYGRSVMEDPKCMPSAMHPYILAMTGLGRPFPTHTHNTLHVPAE